MAVASKRLRVALLDAREDLGVESFGAVREVRRGAPIASMKNARMRGGVRTRARACAAVVPPRGGSHSERYVDDSRKG
jgi:hypothetical protein